MTRPVLVAGFADEVKVLADWCDAQPLHRRDAIAVGLDPETQAEFRRHGFDPRSTLPYLSEARHKSVFLNAARYARAWFRQLSAETLGLLSHDGISYPECLEYDISVVFTEMFLHAELLAAILEQEHPDPLVVVAAEPPRVDTLLITPRERLLFPVAAQICSLGQVPIRALTPPKDFGANHRKSPGLSALFHKIRDLYQATRMEESSLGAFLERGLPVLFSFLFPGNLLYKRKIERYREASRKVLFWGGTKGNESIRTALQRDPAAEVLVLERNRRLRFHQSMVARVDPCQAAGVKQDERTAIQEQADAAWQSLAADQAFRDQFRYGAIQLWPILESRLEFYVRRHFPQCVEFYEATRNFLREQGGDVLVSSLDTGGFTPWVCQAFSSMGKESIYFWHGLLIPHAEIEEGLSPAFLPLHANRVAAFGDGIANWYKQNGVAPERIRLVGSPDLDAHRAELSPRRRASLCRILGLSPERPIIVYATSVTRYGGRRAYSEETGDEILRATEDILEELATDPDLQVVLKLHPGLSARELASFKRLARPYPNAVVCQMPELARLVQLCDILITYQSSAGIEAMACDRNVIIYNTTGRANQYTPQTMTLEDEEPNLALLVSDRSQLKVAVRRLLTDESLREKLAGRRRQLDPYVLFNSDGRALDRAMSLVEEALANGSPQPRNPLCQTKVLASR